MSKRTEEIKETIMSANSVVKKDTEFAPTGSTLLDLIVGGGTGEGFSFGNVINIVGDTGSGKSLMVCEIVAACHYKFKDKFKWIYDDCESGFTFDTKSLYGFEIMPMNVEERVKSDTVEDAYVNVRKFAEGLKKDEFGIYVIDSLDGLTSKEANTIANTHYNKALKGKEDDTGSYRLGKAKYLSQEFFPQLADLLEKTNCLLIIVSQVRENLSPISFNKFVRSGGKAMDFYCHTVLWLAAIKKIKRKDRVVGVVVKAKTTKSKTPRPFREGIFIIDFYYGIDDIATNIDYLYDFRTDAGELVKNASAIWQSGKELNLENLKQFLLDNDLVKRYETEVSSKLKKSEILDWINTDKDIKDKFNNTFGVEMSREELIHYIEENNLEDELRRRVKEKWENIEASVKISRKMKYQV